MLTNLKKVIFSSVITFLGFIMTPFNTLALWWFWDMVAVKWVGVLWTQEKQKDSLILVIQDGINWVLGILAFISLCLILYAGFQILISGSDSKKRDNSISTIKNVAIWLAVIAVSRLIVSLIFYVINWATRPNIG